LHPFFTMEVFAVVRREKGPAVKEALTRAGFDFVSWSVKGRGKEGGLRYRGFVREKVLMPFLPKRAFLLWTEEPLKAVEVITESAHTGAYGDGKVFVLGKEAGSVKMIKAVVRPEKVYEVAKALEKEGIKAMTTWEVYGRGKEGGVQVGETSYGELVKALLVVVVPSEQVEKAVRAILKSARTGAYGDGKVFICEVSEVWTIRTKERGL